MKARLSRRRRWPGDLPPVFLTALLGTAFATDVGATQHHRARIDLAGVAHGFKAGVDGPLHDRIEHDTIGREVGVADGGSGRQKRGAAPITGRPHEQRPAVGKHGQRRAIPGDPARAAEFQLTDRQRGARERGGEKSLVGPPRRRPQRRAVLGPRLPGHAVEGRRRGRIGRHEDHLTATGDEPVHCIGGARLRQRRLPEDDRDVIQRHVRHRLRGHGLGRRPQEFVGRNTGDELERPLGLHARL